MPVLQTVGTYFRNLANAVTGRSVPLGVTAGSIGFSAGGPLFLDAFRSKRPPAPYELVNSYKAIAYSCIRLNQHGVARTPLKLYAKTGRKQARPRRSCSRVASLRTERYIRSQPYLARNLEPDDAVDEIKEHPFLDAMEHPNPYFDYDLLIQHIVASMEVVGTAYFYPTRPLGPDGNPDITQARAGMEIWPFQSQYVYPYKGMGLDDLVKEYRYFGDSYSSDGLIRIRYVSLRDPYLSAYSPLHACFEQAGLTDYYYAIVESILKVGARPSAMVFPKDANIPLGEPERKRIEMDLNNRFTGGRSGHIWVSNGALDIKELQFPPSDLAGLKITENMRLLVANCFDVPISLLQAEDTNRAVASEGTHQHQYYAIEPRCRAIATALTKQLAQPVDDRLFFCFDNPVARDDEREAKIWSMKLADGRATANEAREDDGLEPVEWGDEPWLAGTLKQPSQLEEAHDLGLRQQKEAHEAGLEQQKDGLKTSDQVRKHADERLKMDKEAAQKDSEDRAREEEAKRQYVQRVKEKRMELDEIEAKIETRKVELKSIEDESESKVRMLNNTIDAKQAEIKAIKAEIEAEHSRLRSVRAEKDATIESMNAQIEMKRAESRSVISDLNSQIEAKKAELQSVVSEIEARAYTRVDRVLSAIERDIQEDEKKS